MVAPLCKLSIVGPRELRPVIADALDAIEPALPGYTVMEAEGHGPDTSLATAAEKVRGAMRAVLFLLILPQDRVDSVLAALAARCQRRQLAFWTEPVTDYGRLT